MVPSAVGGGEINDQHPCHTIVDDRLRFGTGHALGVGAAAHHLRLPWLPPALNSTI